MLFVPQSMVGEDESLMTIWRWKNKIAAGVAKSFATKSYLRVVRNTYFFAPPSPNQTSLDPGSVLETKRV